jgi:class 3 adenylate cyclase
LCGAHLEAAHASAREERKIVTVLFCDIVGFTSRAERLDEEDVRALLAPYHEHLRGELELYGGTVEKFIGDAVMALFGAPVAIAEGNFVQAAETLADMEDLAGEAYARLRAAEAFLEEGRRPETDAQLRGPSTFIARRARARTLPEASAC